MRGRTRVLVALAGLLLAGLVWFRIEGPVARVLEHRDRITTVALATDLAPDLLAALVHVESGGDERAEVAGGGVGLLQVTPTAAGDVAGGARPTREELRDPALALLLGARYLALMIKRFGDEELALAAYRLGPSRLAGDLRRAGGRQALLARFSTHPAWIYVRKVTNLRHLYRDLLARS